MQWSFAFEGEPLAVLNVIALFNAELKGFNGKWVYKVSLALECTMTFSGRTPVVKKSNDMILMKIMSSLNLLTLSRHWCTQDRAQLQVDQLLPQCSWKKSCRVQKLAPRTTSCTLHSCHRICDTLQRLGWLWSQGSTPKMIYFVWLQRDNQIEKDIR